jgi:Asp-tRNA(Asn)/Glu-tRNA(Gln) amidotransferase A subunit family amidase
MIDEKYAFSTIRDLSAGIKAKKISPVELTEMFLKRIERCDPQLNAFITVTPELARAQARQAETEIHSGHYRGPLHGVPWGVKDIYDTKGILTTWGSPIYKDRVPDRDSTVVARLTSAGAVLMGKLATGEFAGGAIHLKGQVHNPWKLDRTSGGSSCGPGAATAGGLVTFSMGTETSGSIMGPSGLCGLTGLVPTYGRVSRFGVMSLSWSLDKCGPLCRTADDVAMVLSAVAGADENDPTCRKAPFPYATPLKGNIKGMKLGVVRNEFWPAERAGTEQIFHAALAKLTDLGVHLEDIELDNQYPYQEVLDLTDYCEASSAFEDIIRTNRFDECAQKGRMNNWAAGLAVPSADYFRAQRIRAMIVQYTKTLFAKYDALVAPNNTAPAGLIPNDNGGTRGVGRGGRGTPQEGPPRHLGNMCNISALAYVSTRCGFKDDMPLGIKFVGPSFGERKVLELAHAYEKATTWNARNAQYAA